MFKSFSVSEFKRRTFQSAENYPAEQKQDFFFFGNNDCISESTVIKCWNYCFDTISRAVNYIWKFSLHPQLWVFSQSIFNNYSGDCGLLYLQGRWQPPAPAPPVTRPSSLPPPAAAPGPRLQRGPWRLGTSSWWCTRDTALTRKDTMLIWECSPAMTCAATRFHVVFQKVGWFAWKDYENIGEMKPDGSK